MHVNLRTITAILGLTLLGDGHAPAMAILDFVKLNLDDQATYVTNLVEGSTKMLRSSGHPDEADKTVALFKNSTKVGGVNQLAMNMKTMQLANIRNETNPNNRVPTYDVEAAMAQTLKDNGITVPIKFLEGINRSFAPAFPLRGHQFGQ